MTFGFSEPSIHDVERIRARAIHFTSNGRACSRVTLQFEGRTDGVAELHLYTDNADFAQALADAIGSLSEQRLEAAQ